MIQFSDNTIGAIEFTIRWSKNSISHEEWFLGRKFNPVNDIFPRDMREELEGKHAGECVTFKYMPRMCIPRYKDNLILTRGLERLRPKTVLGRNIIPRVGRFYPQGHINGLRDIYPDTLNPFRLIELDEEQFVADCNHPLATIPITIEARIQDIEERGIGTYGSLTHWREKTCDWGPGMQAMHNNHPTDFFHPGFFDTIDTSGIPFSPPPLDAKAMTNLNKAYARFITPDMRRFDFLLDSSSKPKGQYDAIVFTLSMEYLRAPVTTLKDLSQHLAPGGVVLVGFTAHYDPAEVIQGWIDMYEFERMGLILEYLRQAGLDADAGTISMRNDWRNQDDPKFLETRGVSDPVYIVYGHKK